MKKTIQVYILLFFSLFSWNSFSQGCIATRGIATCNGNFGNTINLKKGEFNIQTSFRYFESYRHFRGDHEEKYRVELGTQVINKSSFLDFTLNYGITDRFFTSLTLPFVNHYRSSMYEHGGNPPNGLGERHSTSSRGISDIRFGFGYWLFDPETSKYNYSLSLGVKLPTGKHDYTDMFYNQGPDRDIDMMAVVDQSIQPGDGGTGLTVDLQGFHPINENFAIVSNVFYLFNFTETNDVPTRSGNTVFSSPDLYFFRLGASYQNEKGFSCFLGSRIEGVPSNDIFGGSKGYRRPGYTVFLEPGFGYFHNNFSAFISVPIGLYRNRVQSYEDKERTKLTGVYSHGDSAFADYIISFNLSYRFGGK